jgi:hypothetical protein
VLLDGIAMTAALNYGEDAKNVRGSNAAIARVGVNVHF